jgi:hypothetical protein
MGVKEDESSTWHVWAVGFHRVTARSCVVHILKLMNPLFFNFYIFSGSDKLRITETSDTESVDTGAQLYLKIQFLNKEKTLQLHYIYISKVMLQN